ncbi:zinc ribbon-containing protein [Candidatus Woesearchaeota archaeon]|nr:zinc ribbon-containing protein [Candidatus Woesearchaeota archaeon]
MRIPGSIFALVGAFLIGFSYYVGTVNESLDVQKFMLFIWVGAGFLLFGSFRMFSGMRSKPKVAKENYSQKGQHHQHAVHEHHPPKQPHGKNVKYCSHCGAVMRHFDKFCHKCGGRSFHR